MKLLTVAAAGLLCAGLAAPGLAQNRDWERDHVRSRTMVPPAAPAPEAGRLQPRPLTIPAPGMATAAEAATFVAEVEAAYARTNAYNNRISWVKSTYITADTNWLDALAVAETARMQLGFSKRAARFNGIAVDPVVRRKLEKIKLGGGLPAPDRPGGPVELAGMTTRLSSYYATLTVPYRNAAMPLDEADEAIGRLRDPGELESLWTAMRHNLPPMRADFERVVSLSNEGARGLGYKDVGDMWRSGYDMPPDEFAALVDQLWSQIEPLYRSLHCYKRARLNEAYGDGVQPRTGPIRNHLTAPKWETVADIYVPKSAGASIDLTKLLTAQGYDVQKLFRTGESFYTSLGFPPLPRTFWERSQFTRPRDRQASCWATAWDIEHDDVRILGCFRVNAEDFYVVHHELGHTYYQLAYKDQPTIFLDSANDGFHEAVGDFVALSARTPTYLKQIGLLDSAAAPESDIAYLMRMFDSEGGAMAFHLALEKWRWDVFSGKVTPSQYNDAWWQYRLRYLGVVPPSARPSDGFDPGGVFHVADFVPAIRYFLSQVYQFQFHRAACRIAGWTGPLHRCSIYGHKEVGTRFAAMLRMGSSRPWPEALAAFTGEDELDAGAILDYFAPLQRWLAEQNQGQACGW